MDVEFHYYVNYIVAVSAGIPKDQARIMAYSSQYVDDNTTKYTVFKNDGGVYKNKISQVISYNKSFRDMENIITCFHFIPGFSDASSRVDQTLNYSSTSADSLFSRIIIRQAIKSKDPYLIGIASHSYADTWAHQNFVGGWHEHNSFKSFPAIIIPSIGHADVFDKPDLVAVRWKDKRLKEPLVSNNLRFLDAACALYREYLHLGYKPLIDLELLKAYLKKIFGKECSYHSLLFRSLGRRKRMKMYLALIQKLDGEKVKKYEPNLWLDESVVFQDGSAKFISDRYKDTHWFKFQESVKYYKRFVHGLIRNVEFESNKDNGVLSIPNYQ